jgi:predicted MFS family arabinose efflux permease
VVETRGVATIGWVGAALEIVALGFLLVTLRRPARREARAES